MGKMKIAIVYGAICGGCDVAIVNWGEKLIDIAKKYDIVYWNAAVDSKLEDLEKIDHINIGIFMGSIRTDLHVKLAKLLRSKSDIIVAYGACASYGGVPGLATLTRKEKLIKDLASTITTEKIEEEDIPDPAKIPELLKTNYALIQIIDPDIIIPGCPPSSVSNEELAKFLLEYQEGTRLKEKIVFGEENSLCSICPRRPEDLHKIKMPGIYRLYEVKLDENKCFLEQGIICMGPATRAACKAPCIKNNHPCVGCMGPAPGVDDVGLKYISSVASLVMVDKEKEILEEGLAKQLDKIVDPIGVFYKYTLSNSLIAKLAKKSNKRDEKK
ncbi:MAG: hypothetical protein B6U89_01940 [Desulfurococcales archaeon ex4484_58]|nr:MAG: hypothetical protein B6U89_01940 [Desulfurococcales archaeon ex4484_58]